MKHICDVLISSAGESLGESRVERDGKLIFIKNPSQQQHKKMTLRECGDKAGLDWPAHP